ncbi:MAG: ABC transporter substrate-binding protein [Burkholderiales bacterium]|nr:ABC transporter substrate-binding protein [Burkholderiales bacterium]
MSAQPAHPRRRLCLGGAVASLLALAGCRGGVRGPLRLGCHPWPGYELFFLARDEGHGPMDAVHLVDMPSASASLRGLSTQSLDAAGLTLDEVLSARARGMDLRVVGVLDVSMGADVVLARPGLGSVAVLAGRRVGVESSAVGAVMLDAMLSLHGMRVGDVQVVSLAVDQHEAAWREGHVDALVTYDPVSGRLQAEGAVALFSSAEVPGRIVDVLAVRGDVLGERAAQVRAALSAHFATLAVLRQAPQRLLPAMAARLGVSPAELAASLTRLELPGVAENQAWLRPGGRLQDTAGRLGQVMVRAGLLPGAPVLDGLGSGEYLPDEVAA